MLDAYWYDKHFGAFIKVNGGIMIKDIRNQNGEAKLNQNKIETMKELFPNCFDRDGKLNLTRLQTELSSEYSGLDYTTESYELNFLGKKYAKFIADLKTETVLKPDADFNKKPENINSENIYITGDNLDALKHLSAAYEGAIKCIYIDPPYNTGSKDFAYNDSFGFDLETLQSKLNLSEKEADHIIEITSSHSSSHSAWLMFMYPRLVLAWRLLKSEGVIFISIDDNEQANLKLICDDIFGEDCFVTTIHCQMSTTQGMKVKAAQSGNLVKNAEYILCYSKDGHKDIAREHILYDLRPAYDDHYTLYLRDDGTIGQLYELYDYRHPDDCYGRKSLKASVAFQKSERFKKIVSQNLSRIVRSDKVTGFDDVSDVRTGRWLNVEKDNRTYLLTRDKKGKICQLMRLGDSWGKTDGYYEEVGLRKVRGDWWDGFYIDMGNVSKEGGIPFEDGKKPVRLIKQLCQMVTKDNDIILDFFSGSATTAHAVMKLNAEDGGKRRYIMVQQPEPCKKTSKIYKFRTIDEAGRARIKNSADEVYKKTKSDIDYGYKHYTVESTPADLLDRLENFVPERINDSYNLYKAYGVDTILATWKLRDRSMLTTPVDEIDLGGYTAYRCRDYLYLVKPEISIEHIKNLMERYDPRKSVEDGGINCGNVVLFGYSFTFSEVDMIKDNLKQIKNFTNTNVVVHTRY